MRASNSAWKKGYKQRSTSKENNMELLKPAISPMHSTPLRDSLFWVNTVYRAGAGERVLAPEMALCWSKWGAKNINFDVLVLQLFNSWHLETFSFTP